MINFYLKITLKNVGSLRVFFPDISKVFNIDYFRDKKSCFKGGWFYRDTGTQRGHPEPSL